MLPDVGGFHRQLDYLVPDEMAPLVRPGTIVRVPLQGRRARGWVLACPVEPPAGVVLRPLAKVSGWGPEPELLELAEWAAWRWWGRPRSFLATASPPGVVPLLPPPLAAHFDGDATALAGAVGQLVREAWAPGAHLLRLPPSYRATDVVMSALSMSGVTERAHPRGRASEFEERSFPKLWTPPESTTAALLAEAQGPLLVVAPTTARAEAGRAALARCGVSVALLPGQWAQARAGRAQVVIGARGAAWGPCPGLAGAVVLDAHDEGLAQEQAPTWDAVSVVVERARRAGAPCLLVSPCPTLELLALAGDVAHRVSTAEERRGWAPVTVVDPRSQDPRVGLYSPPVVDLLRGEGRVTCVLNRKGRAQLLACGPCGAIATCERCRSAVHLMDDRLACRHCRASRPVICLSCGSVRLRWLRVGVSRAREQLEALAGRPVGEVTEATKELPDEPVLVGTESLLYREGALRRAGGVGAVVFLDFDQELLAPRYRAGEEALALLARASRLVGGRSDGGRVVVQTRVPDHAVIQAALSADPGLLSEAERPVRQQLRLPPYGALALVSGPGAAELVDQLTAARAHGPDHFELNHNFELNQRSDDSWLVKAPSYSALADALASTSRPAAKVRVEIGPPRV